MKAHPLDLTATRVARDWHTVATAIDQCRAAGGIVAIDGRSGSGKTALAALLADHLPTVRVLHLEDAYRGWDGLAAGLVDVAQNVLAPLRNGRSGAFRTWDWERSTTGADVVVRALAPDELLLVEGCGALADLCNRYVDFGVWCEAPTRVRFARARARDPYDWSDQWESWAAQEASLIYSRSADLVLHTA